VVDALRLPAWVVGFSLVGVGGLARDAGYPFGAAVLSTPLIWAGPAQVILFGAVAGGAGLATVALLVGLSSVRLLPMSITLLPLLRRPGQGWREQVLLVHFVAVTVWVESLRRLPAIPIGSRVPYYLGFAGACILLSTASTGVGYALVGAVPRSVAAGLLFLTPIYFTATLVAGARTRADRLAVILGFALLPPLAGILPAGSDLVATGLLGGTGAFLAARLRRTR